MTDPGTSSHRTSSITSTTTTTTVDTSTSTGSVLHLKLTKPKCSKSVSWTKDTIDNESMDKKKSKICCVYHKPKKFGESSSSESDDDDEVEPRHPRIPRKRDYHHRHSYDNLLAQRHGRNHGHIKFDDNKYIHDYSYQHDASTSTRNNIERDAEVISRGILTNIIDKVDQDPNPFRALLHTEYEHDGYGSDTSDP